jgi:WD40 repeat protein
MIKQILLYSLVSFSAEAQIFSGGEEVPIKIINYSRDGHWIGRTHLNPYEIKIINPKDSSSGLNIGTENGDIKCFDFSPSSDSVVIGTYQGFVELWTIGRGRIFAIPVHHGQINDVKFLDSNSVVSCGRDGSVRRTSLEKKTSTVLRRQSAIINSIEVAGNPFSQLLYLDHHGKLGIIDLASGKLLLEKQVHDAMAFDLILDKINLRLFTAGYDGHVCVWKFPEIMPILDFSSGPEAIFSIDYDPVKDQVVSGGSSKRIDLWDISTGKLVNSYSGHTDRIFVVRFTPDHLIISGSRDLTYKIWEPK